MTKHTVDPTNPVPDVIGDVFPDTAPMGVRDTSYVYGQLYRAYLMNRYGATAENSLYVTPGASEDILGTPGSVVTVRVDLTGHAPSYEGIDIKPHSEELVPKLWHAKYAAARGKDHSITHQTGETTAKSTAAGYASKRLTDWATDETVQEVADSHENGEIIKDLALLGENEDVVEAIEEDAEKKMSGKQKRLITVQIKTENGWQDPGEFPVLMAAMRALKREKLFNKNDADDSRGDGVCYVTGDEGTVNGLSSDPIRWYSSKQQESFDALDSEEAWRTQGLSTEAALAASQAGEFFESCRYTSAGLSIYVLPYFTGEQTRVEIQALYEALVKQLQDRQKSIRADEDTGMENPGLIEDIYSELQGRGDVAERLRFHVLGMQKYQPQRWRLVFSAFETPAMSVVDLANKHTEVVKRLDGIGFPPWLTSDSSKTTTDDEEDRDNRILDEGASHSDLVGSPWYIRQTVTRPDEDDTPSVDDAIFRMHRGILSGDGVAVSDLIKEYGARVVEDWSPDDGNEGIPVWTVAKQYAQLCALGESGLLNARDPRLEPLTRYYESESMVDTNSNTTDGDAQAEPETSQEQYEVFISSHPPLKDDHERQAAFVLGALVGEMSQVQEENGKSPMSKTHTAETITKRTFSRTAMEVVDLVNIYTDNAKIYMVDSMFGELTDRLADTVHQSPPEEWEISTHDMQLHYTLGVAYGKNRWAPNTGTDADDSSDSDSADDDSSDE